MDYDKVKMVLMIATAGAAFFSVPSIFFFEDASLARLGRRVRESVVGFIGLFVLIALVASVSVFFCRPDSMTDEGADRYERASSGR
ncbi:hypothetical protein [Geomonas ferrireducens]|uniref:hypothetical protein n=1 Tax=Geomonas ferrireducens TaxID=2570227 RepID=UPI0010A7D51A|nr:hypothetical protein [Geomonas ferrireducens]